MTHWSAAGPQDFTQAPSRAMILQILGSVGQLCLTARTPEHAFAAACRFSPLWSSWSYTLSRAHHLLLLRAHVPRIEIDSLSVADVLARAWIWRELAACVGGVAALPRAAYVGYVRLELREALRASSGCKMDLEQPVLGLDFSRADLQGKNRYADARLYQLLEMVAFDVLHGRKQHVTKARRRRASYPRSAAPLTGSTIHDHERTRCDFGGQTPAPRLPGQVE